MHKKIELRAANEERLRVKMHEVRYDPVHLTKRSQRQEQGGSQGDSIHSEGC